MHISGGNLSRSTAVWHEPGSAFIDDGQDFCGLAPAPSDLILVMDVVV
jgi:hypothetical protein